MSPQKSFRDRIKSIVPKQVLNKYRQYKTAISPINLAPPVLQMYIDDGSTQSYLGINNFYSFLSASTKTDAVLDIQFLDHVGNVVLKMTEKIAHFESRFPNVTEILAQRGVQSPFGIVTVQLKPVAPRKSIYKRMGLSSAHFFMFYKDRMGSVSMVHPSSTADAANAPAGAYVSNQIVVTTSLSAVVLYQCNPCLTPHEMTHSLLDAMTGETVAQKTSKLTPMGTERVEFKMSDLKYLPSHLKVTLSSLPSANSKPMLCRVYGDGVFSMSHS